MKFPIDLSDYEPVELDMSEETLPAEKKEQLENNIRLVRDVIIFYTAYAGAKGLGGHTGGAYDIVPEVLIADGFMKGDNDVYPVLFDEAGHRVAIQYVMAVLNQDMPVEKLLHYREFSEKDPLPGHPELSVTSGVKFSSGRLGHIWSFANGVARGHPGKAVVVFGSDGSQQEGNDAEAARFAVANSLNIKLFVDDNNVTIAGHPNDYMKGYDIAKTLEGHGLKVTVGDPEDLDALYSRMRESLMEEGPVALVNRREMAPGVPGIEGSTSGHDVIDTESAIKYLKERGYGDAVRMLKEAEKEKDEYEYKGSSKEQKKNRSEFGKYVNEILEKLEDAERKERVVVIDCDLEGSTGIKAIGEKFPEIYIKGGVMERNNYSAAAGFGFEKGKQGIFATFSAFSEMVNSEITMARLNEANVLAHFSHAGVDDMADNTCHFGMNVFFTDNGLEEEPNTRLYFPADACQLKAVLEKVFWDEGLRFIFTTRSSVPFILDKASSRMYEDYEFTPGKDEVVREGTDGYVVSYGDMLYRCLDAVERLKEEGVEIGLINKPTLNVIDEDMMKKLSKAPFVLVAESQNIKTGLGSRFGTWLLKRGFKGKYDHVGATKGGRGGVSRQIPWQELDPDSIKRKIREMLAQ